MPMNKGENIYSMKGFRHVFLFTLKQTFKNKSYIASFVIFVLMMTLMGPFIYLTSSSGMSTADKIGHADLEDAEIESLTIVDQTGISYGETDLKKEDAGLADTKVTIGSEMPDTANLGPRDVVVLLAKNSEGYRADVILGRDSEISIKDADTLGEYMQDTLWNARLKAADVEEEDLSVLSKGIVLNGAKTEADYREELAQKVSSQSLVSDMSAFAILMFIVASMSVSFIIASVNEEKSSKLVESLLVSVRPAALLMGKILGMMTYILSVLICGYAGSVLSDKVMRSIITMDERYAGPAFNFKIFRDHGITGFLMLLATVILGYLISGIISGVFGSACSSEEDIGTATSFCMMFSVIGYVAAFIVPNINSSVMNHVSALVPPLSFYTLPVLVMSGRVSVLVALLSYLIQIVILAVLFLLMAKVYRNLLLSDKSKPKLNVIFRSMKG